MSRLELGKDEFTALRDFVQEMSGIAVGDEKSYLIETRLATLVVEAGCDSFMEFHKLISADKSSPFRDKVVDAMTTNETLWFRDKGPWTILEKELIKRFCEELQSGKRQKVRIWSAAASTGQEAYSVGITILDYLKEHPMPGVKEESFEICGTDLSPSALFIAISGRYDGLSVSRGLDPDVRDEYFEQAGRVWKVQDRVKKMVKFQKYNLMDSYAPFGHFDLVLCRNVLIYFSPDLKRDIVARITETQGSDGSLIVGASESLQGCLSKLALRQCDGQFYYQVKPGA